MRSMDYIAENTEITAYNSYVTARNTEVLGYIATYNSFIR